MDQHRGLFPMSLEVATRWREALAAQAMAVRALGGECLFLLAPDKQSLFWDRLFEAAPDHRNSRSIFGLPIPGLAVVDPVAALTDAARRHDVYPRTDSHWDCRGAFIAYRQLLAALTRADGPPLEEGHDFAFTTLFAAGDLGRRLVPPDQSEAARVQRLALKARPVYRNGIPEAGAVIIHRRKGRSGTALLFSDGFGVHLAPFLAEHYGTLVHVRTAHMDAELIRQIRPDSVICVMGERLLVNPPPLREDDPVELLTLRRIARREVKEENIRKGRLLATEEALPASLHALRRRNDALADMLAGPGAPPSPAQVRFLEDAFPGAGVAEVVTAAFLARHAGRRLAPGWQQAVNRLHPDTKAKLAEACDRLPAKPGATKP